MKWRIAVIDNGINEELLECFDLHSKSEIRLLQILDQNCSPQFLIPDKIKESHGTLCAAILIEFLNKYGVDNYSISSISILNKKREQRIDEFCTALEWCVAQKMDIVLMSIGIKIPTYAKRLLPIIKKAKKEHMLLLAATSNGCEITYPACYEAVIGIKRGRDKQIEKNTIIVINNPGDGIEVEGYLRKSDALDKYNELSGEEYGISNSFTVPFVAANLCAILQKNEMNNRDTLLDEFAKRNRSFGEESRLNLNVSDEVPMFVVYYAKEIQKRIDMEELIKKFELSGYSCVCLSDWQECHSFEKNIFALSEDKIYQELLYYKLYLRNNSLAVIFMNRNKQDLDFSELIEKKIILDIYSERNYTDIIFEKIIQE